MKVYDCLMYWDEDLILDLRFNILDKYVDKFVVVESNKTWQNNQKDLKFDINKFKNFKDKIIYVPVKNMPEGDNPWSRENFQRSMLISCFSFTEVAREASKVMKEGGSMITLSYEANKAIPNYNVMGVCKAALESSVKYLARDL